MVDLTPAPESLGLASPALGPWFHSDGGDPLPELGLPASDLSVSVSMATDMQWRAPAGCIVSYFIATDPRPAGITLLRQENGTPAFAANDVVVLLTLLPEAELRLHALCNAIPSPDGTSVPANTPSRPRVRYLAMAIPSASVPNISTLENLREANFPSFVSSDEEKAAYVGLKLDGGTLSNANEPSTELHRPARDSAVILENRTSSDIGMALWAFDYRGRPLDAGAVATWWSHLAAPGVFDNLWAHEDAALQITATATDGNVAHLTTAQESALSTEHLARLTRTGLTQTAGSNALFTVANPASISLAMAPDPDDAPVPRIALLPHTNYADPDTRGATLFDGWHGTSPAWPATLNRDFARIAMLDIESHLVGLTRNNNVQASERTRINALRNTQANPFLTITDSATQRLLDVISNGDDALAMSPVMDHHWGALTQGSFGTEALPDTLAFSVKGLRGAGQTDGATVSEQKVVVHFPDGALPAGAWIRCWPHGLDTDTGTRYRQNGGGALADAAGEAFVVMPVPDGTAAPSAADASPVRLSFDALLVTDDDARYYIEQRYNRPPVITGDPVSLPASPGVPADTTLWLCEQGQAMTRAAGAYASGQNLLALPDNLDAGEFALVDLSSLDDADVSADTLRNAASGNDSLVVTTPAFQTTAQGDVTTTPGPGGATVVHRTRNGLTDATTFGRPAPLMERREVLAVDREDTAALVGASPGRASRHESRLATQGHPGMPASDEVHGAGVALSGPAVAPINVLMQERVATSLEQFMSRAQAPVTAINDPGGTTAFTAVLETLTFGVTGDALVRTFVEALPSFAPGQRWLDIKEAFESATSFDLDPHIDSSTFDDEALAAAFDRIILKTKEGLSQAATSMEAAIRSAEDFIYIETPAIDPLDAGNNSIDIVNAINVRRLDRPGLKVLLCVPEEFLPGQPDKLKQIRKAGIAAAHQRLKDIGAEHVELFTPLAGSGRRLHMAATTIIVDDVYALTGSTHLWRRGLTFDSSVAVALFDENVSDGRSTAIRNARRQLFADRLGLDIALVPDDPADMLDSVRATNRAGGLLRVRPDAFPAAEDPTNDTELSIWNPDGKPGTVSDWFLFFGALAGDVADDVNNAIR